MHRIFPVILSLLFLSTFTAAQSAVPLDQALIHAFNDINERLDTHYAYEGGQVAYKYNEERLTGSNLGCASVAATDSNVYFATTIEVDVNLDDFYEWEYRFAYDREGMLITVVCRTPNSSNGFLITLVPSATPTPTSTPTPTPTITPTAAPIYVRQEPPRFLQPMTCGGLPTRLVVGSTGRVILGDVSNNLRQAPNIDAAHVGDLLSGTLFVVVDGPLCVEDIAWYAVTIDGILAGWTAEGQRGDYYSEPVLTDAIQILPGNVGVVQAVGAPFTVGTLGLTAPHAGVFVAYENGKAVVWALPLDTFTTMAEAQWQPTSEIVGQFNYIQRDFDGRIWTSDALSGMLTAANDPSILSISFPANPAPVLAVDMESFSVASFGAAANTITIHSIDRNGDASRVTATFTLGSAIRDLVFRADGMALYAATDTQIALFVVEPGIGWLPAPQALASHDLANPKLAVNINGTTLAVTGVRADGLPGLRLFGVSASDPAQLIPGPAPIGEAGTSWSRPALNPDGSLVAVGTVQGTVRLSDTSNGSTLNELSTGGFGPVVFSTDGLILLAPTINAQMQMYGVPIVQPSEIAPGLPTLIPTADAG